MKQLSRIAAQLEGYDPQALRADVVNDFLAKLVSPIQDTQTVPLMEALGRVVASDVISPIDVPAHDNSAMDGYAFAGAQLGDTSLELKVLGTSYAGKAWNTPVPPGSCIKIMTGAVMPTGLDTVVPQEMVTASNAFIAIAAGTLHQGDNRRFRGEDLRKDTPALRAGTLISPAALGLLASLGLPEVTVLRRLKVAFFSTGDEIMALGETPREGAVYDSNRFTIFGLLKRLGVEVLDLGLVKDDPEALEAAFRLAASQADAIITSGGVSVGEADHTKAMMHKLADSDDGVAFWKVAMRPGRPMAVGQIGKTILFGLPGNPVAVMVTFLAFVRPALLQMMGTSFQPQLLLKAQARHAIRKKAGRTEYQRGVVTRTPDGTLGVHITGQQGSGVLSSMVQANGLLVLHHDQGNVEAGDDVDVMMFEGAI